MKVLDLLSKMNAGLPKREHCPCPHFPLGDSQEPSGHRCGVSPVHGGTTAQSFFSALQEPSQHLIPVAQFEMEDPQVEALSTHLPSEQRKGVALQ